MLSAHEFLKNLALVLGVAALTTVVFQKLRQPVVLGYLLAGLIIGPHVPIPLVANEEMVRALSELGVVLVMFSLGLEFRLRKLVAVGGSVALTALLEVSLMIWLGFLTGRLFGWSPRASLFAGAMVAISSTTIIARAFDEHAVRGKLRDIVFGVLIFEDLIAIVMLASMSALSAGQRLSSTALALTTARLALFVIGVLSLGMLTVPRAFRAIVRLGRSETILVAAVGFCFALALLAQAVGYSVALGAFAAGTLVAESGEEPRIAPLVRPVRDIFAAIFFVAAGMSIDPAIIAHHAGVATALFVVVVLGKIVSVALGSFLAGHGTRLAVQAGMSLAQIGEFSFIIVSVGRASGLVPDFLYPTAIAVSAATALTTPWLIRAAAPAAAAIDRALPARLQTFASLYSSWIEQLREAPRPTTGMRVRRFVLLLLVDAALLAAVVVGASLALDPIAAVLQDRLAMQAWAARLLVVAAAVVVSVPFLFGIVRLARGLGLLLADRALPRAAGGGLDQAAAPRRALVVTFQLASVMGAGAPLVAITQPFLPPFQGAAALLLVLALLGVAFWRSAANLQGHVRAGAQVIVEALAAQSHRRDTAEVSLDMVQKLLPGLGAPVPLRLERGSGAVGKTLAEVNLRGATGATVLALTRGEHGTIVPGPGQRLAAGDVLALAGSHDAIAAAVALLAPPPAG